MKTITKIIYIWIAMLSLPSLILAQCPTSGTDLSLGAGTHYLFDVDTCSVEFNFGTTYTSDGGAEFGATTCLSNQVTLVLTGGMGPDQLPMTINFGGSIGTCAYDASGLNFRLPIYVKHDATGANNGLSWTDAYTDLQDGIDAATEGDQIWVAAGTYYPTRDDDGNPNGRENTFYIQKDSVKIYGGFAGTEGDLSQRDIAANETILSGDLGAVGDSTDNAYAVMTIKPSSGKSISSENMVNGFTIEEGNADGNAYIFRRGGGIIISSGSIFSSPTISNCQIKNNTATAEGGGIYVQGSTPFITGCTFSDNISTVTNGGGGGIYSSGGHPVIRYCTFMNNEAEDEGAAILGSSTARITIDSCQFNDNLAERGAAISLYEGVLTNSNFENNYATINGGALNIDSETGDTLIIQNCQFTGNIANRDGGAIYQTFKSGVYIIAENLLFDNNYAEDGGALGIISTSSFAKGTVFNHCVFKNNNSKINGSTLFFRSSTNAKMQPIFNNCLIYNNATSYKNMISSYAFPGGDVQAKFNHCTITGNSSSASLISHSDVGHSYNNSILWGLIYPSNSSSNNFPTYTNTLIKDYNSEFCWDSNLGTDNDGNIGIEPMFADTANGDFSLLPQSPAINAGNNDSVFVTVDLTSNTRVFDGKVDLGAFESQVAQTLRIGLDSISFKHPSCPASTDGFIKVYTDLVGDVAEYSIDDGTTWQNIDSFAVGVGSYDIRMRLKNNTTYERAYACPLVLIATDITPPIATSKNILLYLNSAGQATLTPSDLDNSSTDNCDASLTFSADKTTFTCADLGANTVVMTAADDDANTDTASAIVTVLDTISPMASAMGLTIYLDGSGNAALTATQINNGSSDACDASPALSINKTAFTCADLGSNNVTLTVTDASGNFSTSTVTVTVADTVSPTPVTQNINAYLDAAGQVTITPSDVDNGSTDNCLSALVLILDVSSFSCTDLGANTVNFTATDAYGNANSTTATVTVIDTVSPVMATQNITIQLDAFGNASITTANIDNGTTDNCTASPTLSLDITAFDCSFLGANTVTLTATDANGNTNTQTATVTVEDVTAPVMATQDITIQLDANGQATITTADIDNGTVDVCDAAPILSLDITNFSCADLGANTVTLTAVDASGNTNSMTATVTVEDVTAPVMAIQNITVQLDANGQTTITIADIDNGTADVCDTNPTITLDITAFDCSNVGINTVTLTATDASGNTNSQTATVTVEDNVVPNISASNLTIALDENGEATLAIADVTYNVSDNCDPNPALSLDITSFSCADLGENTVTITALDIHGNSNSATFTVMVVDQISPTITCQPFEWRVDGTGLLEINPDDLIADVWDNCNYTTFTEPATLSVDNVGENLVTVTVEDESGNQASCQSVLTVLFDCVTLNSIVTPNGDGKNDIWLLACLGAVNNEVFIYNDMGQLIFQATNYIGGWDGRNMEGVDMPQAAYFYVIKVVINGQDRLFKGNITLLR